MQKLSRTLMMQPSRRHIARFDCCLLHVFFFAGVFWAGSREWARRSRPVDVPFVVLFDLQLASLP